MIPTGRQLLTVENLQLVKGKKKIFQIAHFSLREGEVVALVGPNGAGKTSMILTLALLQQPTQGEIRFNGMSVSSKNSLSLRRRLAVVFQEPLLMDTTVLGNLMTGMLIRGIPQKEARQRAEEWLERLGIAHLRDRSALQLSGGEAQRVNLARAFALRPEILFLDEPFSALDYPTRCTLLDEIGSIIKETGTTTLFVTHDYTEIPLLAGRVVVMLDGHLIKNGTVAEVLGEEAAVFQRIPVPWE